MNNKKGMFLVLILIIVISIVVLVTSQISTTAKTEDDIVYEQKIYGNNSVPVNVTESEFFAIMNDPNDEKMTDKVSENINNPHVLEEAINYFEKRLNEIKTINPPEKYKDVHNENIKAREQYLNSLIDLRKTYNN